MLLNSFHETAMDVYPYFELYLDRLFPVFHCYNDSHYCPIFTLLRIAPSSASQISFPATVW
uniref:Uncharacterized protein n=1 Tax=Pristionchus pacificus TaxID=54126 RepID=A0A2A6CI68_PRIPA|eukprot:PDM77839.1 hypothetical protein PRIPAC_34706 [Pristionchus pacificus]